MPRYRIITFVDITRTQASKTNEDQRRIAQQSNFNSLIQAIGMRSNVDWTEDPRKEHGSAPAYFDGKAVYWSWEFEVEREDVFLKEEDPAGLLKDDLHGVPIINLLENTVDITPAIIQTRGSNINTWAEII